MKQCYCSILYLGDVRNPQDKADCAHDQGQQGFSLKQTRKFGAQLIFYARYDDLHVGKLWDSFVSMMQQTLFQAVIQHEIEELCHIATHQLVMNIKDSLHLADISMLTC